jgi:hypothetical protein
MDTRDLYKLIRGMEENHEDDDIRLHDSFDIELNESFVIETGVVGFTEDGGVIVHLDEDALEFLGFHGILNESEDEIKVNEKLSNRAKKISTKTNPTTIQKKKFGQIDEYMKLGGGGDAAEGGTRVMGEGEAGNSNAAEEAIRWRILRTKPELVSKYGPVKIMSAIEDVASHLHNLDEIGSSDVSIWVNEVIRTLEEGHYDHMTDDDEELNEIKRLAGNTVEEEELEEGLKTWALGGAALIAAITGINKYEASQMMKNDPQLAKLAHFREVAQQKGDEAKVQELDDRIKQTLDHLTVTGDEVRDEMGRPVDPQYESVEIDEAEYQGHKVTLNKPTSGDVKKSKVYVKKPNGKVVKVNFGDPNMRIKKNSPSHRKSFRARHHCENPGPKWKARYWSCKAW